MNLSTNFMLCSTYRHLTLHILILVIIAYMASRLGILIRSPVCHAWVSHWLLPILTFVGPCLVSHWVVQSTGSTQHCLDVQVPLPS